MALIVILSKDYKLLPSGLKFYRPLTPADRKWPSQAAKNGQYLLPIQIEKSCFCLNVLF